MSDKLYNFSQLWCIAKWFTDCSALCACSEYGVYMGALKDTKRGVTGDMYAVDKNTIFVANFSMNKNDAGKNFLHLWYIVSLE